MLTKNAAACKRIRQAMSAMRFPGSPKRKQRVTAEQAMGDPRRRLAQRVALAQAFRFEVMLRQKVRSRIPAEALREAFRFRPE